MNSVSYIFYQIVTWNMSSSTTTPTTTSTPPPWPTPTPGPTPNSGPAWTYGYSVTNRNDYTGFVGAQVVLNSSYTSFTLTQVGVPYQIANGASYPVTVYVLNSAGAILTGPYSLTVVAGSEFAYSYVNVSHTFAAGATFYILIATTNGGFIWNNIESNPISTPYLSVPPNSIIPVAGVTGCYAGTLPGVPSLYGSTAAYARVLARGYTTSPEA